MAHFGIVSHPVRGRLYPLVAIGLRLIERGNRVTMLCHQESPEIVDATVIPSVEFCPGPDLTQPPTPYPRSKLRKLVLQILRRFDLRAGLYFSGVCSYARVFWAYDYWTRCELEWLKPAVRRHAIDVLIASDTSFACRTVAEEVDIPLASVSTGMSMVVNPDYPPEFTSWRSADHLWARKRNRVANVLKSAIHRPLLDRINRRRAQRDLPAHRNLGETVSPTTYISNMPPEFDFPLPGTLTQPEYVGPVLESNGRESVDFPWDALDDRPILYVSCGTILDRARFFSVIAEACRDLDVQLVITRGGGQMPRAEDLPGAPLVVDYAPQLEVLEKASLVITHGSMNTVVESLSRGVPLIVIPQSFDQVGVGVRVELSGSGRCIYRQQARVAVVRRAIADVLSNPKYLVAASRVQVSCEAGGGVDRAVGIVAALAERGTAHAG